MPSSDRPRIVEHFKEVKPSTRYTRVVEEVLNRLPQPLLQDLDVVILRDRASLTRAERQRGMGGVLGHYRKPFGHEGGQIHLMVDRILDRWPRWTHRAPVLKDEMVLRVLFHELAHHEQEKQAPGKAHDEQEVHRAGVKLHVDSLRNRRPVLRFVVGGVYRLLAPFVRPWFLRVSRGE